MSVLVLAEHDHRSLKPSTLHAIAAARQLGGDIHVLVAGSDARPAAEEAAAIDVQIAAQWSAHPRVFVVEPTEDFLQKAARALALLRREVPECCRHHVRRFFWDDGVSAEPES